MDCISSVRPRVGGFWGRLLQVGSRARLADVWRELFSEMRRGNVDLRLGNGEHATGNVHERTIGNQINWREKFPGKCF